LQITPRSTKKSSGSHLLLVVDSVATHAFTMASSAPINIAGINKVELLHALWKASKVAPFYASCDAVGLKVPNFDLDKAGKAVHDYIDYFQGRLIKMDLSGDTLDPSGYDRDLGAGAVARAIAAAKLMPN
jgi:hypothetical protein